MAAATWRRSRWPEAGQRVAVRIEPVTSPATHRLVVGQPTSQVTQVPLAWVTVQTGAAVPGIGAGQDVAGVVGCD